MCRGGFEEAAGARGGSAEYGNPVAYQSGGRRSDQCADGVSGTFYHEGTVAEPVSSLDLQKSGGISGTRQGTGAGKFPGSENRPNRYLSREALKEKRIDFEELREYYKDKDWMCDRLTTLETHLKILGTLSPFAAINFIRKGMGYEEYLREYAQYRKIKPEELLETLDRIHESTRGLKLLRSGKPT